MVLAYVVYYEGKAKAVYVDLEQAKWCRYLLGSTATIKKLTSKTLLKILTRTT